MALHRGQRTGYSIIAPFAFVVLINAWIIVISKSSRSLGWWSLSHHSVRKRPACPSACLPASRFPRTQGRCHRWSLAFRAPDHHRGCGAFLDPLIAWSASRFAQKNATLTWQKSSALI